MLTAAELSRYQRQIALPDVGLQGQQRLHDARVLIVGAGGLGSPAALYLAAAGVGLIGIVDDDRVEVSNLHRQILHGMPDIGRKKTESAVDALRRLNADIRIVAHHERLTPARAEALFPNYDLVIDGSDNYGTRYAVNDACAHIGMPWVYGSVERFAGQVSVFCAAGGPCYRCIFPEAPAPGTTPSCEEVGVLGAVPGVVGSLQAVEALKCILGSGDLLVGRLLQLDLRTMNTHVVRFERRADCAACSASGGRAHGRENGNAHVEADDMEPGELVRRLQETPSLQLIDVREPWEWAISQIGQPQRIPVNDLPSVLDALDQSRELIVYCHHGVRSGIAAEWLRAQGFRARNLAGGIDRWSREIDPSVRRY